MSKQAPLRTLIKHLPTLRGHGVESVELAADGSVKMTFGGWETATPAKPQPPTPAKQLHLGLPDDREGGISGVPVASQSEANDGIPADPTGSEPKQVVEDGLDTAHLG